MPLAEFVPPAEYSAAHAVRSSRPIESAARVVRIDGHHDALLDRIIPKLPPIHPLRYPAFVQHYYRSSRWCHLYGLVDGDENPLGVLGIERMPFQTPIGPATVGFASNFLSLVPGAGGYLFLYWLRSCDLALVYGGNAQTHAHLARFPARYYSGIEQWQLNRGDLLRPDARWWNDAARAILSWIPQRRRLKTLPERLPHHSACQATEVDRFTRELLPVHPPYALRFAPTADYLNWRYAAQLSFVRYRIFQLTSHDRPCGYVVINDQGRRLIVAQADADDPVLLVRGILAALAAASTGLRASPGVVLTASSPTTRLLLSNLGFRRCRRQRPFALAGKKLPPAPGQTADDWLVHFDWGDNGLRPPFLGSPRCRG